MEHILRSFLQICEYRSRLGCVSTLNGAVIILLMELNIIMNYLAISVLTSRWMPSYAHNIGRLKVIREVRRWSCRFTLRTLPVLDRLLTDTILIFTSYTELIMHSTLNILDLVRQLMSSVYDFFP